MPRGTLTPTLSQRERGSEAGLGRYKQDQPLSLWERVAEGRVRVPNHPATSVRCRWDRPTCHEVPSPQPSPRGRKAEDRQGFDDLVHDALLASHAVISGPPGHFRTPSVRPGEGPQSPCYTRPLPLGPAYLPRGALTPTLSQRERGSEAGPGRYKQDQPLSLRERVAEGRVRVPNHPATSVRCRWDRPTCHEVPSPQPSPRGRGGRRLGPGRYKQDQPPLPLGEGVGGHAPPRPCIERPISRGQSATSPRGRSCRSSRGCLPGPGSNRAGRRSPGLWGP